MTILDILAAATWQDWALFGAGFAVVVLGFAVTGLADRLAKIEKTLADRGVL